MQRIKEMLKKLYAARNNMLYRKRVVNDNHSVQDIDSKAPDFRHYGFSLAESIIYGFGDGGNDYKNYITTWEAYQPRLADDRYFCISDDKYLFSLVFDHYVRTPKAWMLIKDGTLISLDSSMTDIHELFRKGIEQGGFTIKDRSGSDGFEVYVIREEKGYLKYKNQVVDESLLNTIVSKFKHGLVQDIVMQGDYGNGIFAGSINTIRIITMRKNDAWKHQIIGAMQRIGTDKSAPVDNFNQGGLCAPIDLNTGTLGKATGLREFDENGRRKFYTHHPDSGSRIEGVQVPNWDKLKETVLDITEKLPFFDYIAWDVVVQDDGFAVIETNMKSSLNVFQIHGGLRNSTLGKAYREHGFLVDEKYIKNNT